MFKGKKLNNNGSTMVMAMIAIAFVALLATMILAASFANINMKRSENRSKDTFYTAETVLDEVQAGIGHDSIESLRTSYEYVLSHLVQNKNGYSYVINNDEANKEFRVRFIENMLSELTDGTLSFGSDGTATSVDPTILSKVTEYLNVYINGYYTTEDGILKSANVMSVGKITALRENSMFGNTIILTDVVIDYKEDKAEENYFAKVTVDLDITFPDMEIDFTGGNRLSNFLEYSLVADSFIQVAGTNLNASGAHLYAGSGYNIVNGGILNVTGNVISTVGDVSNANVVTRGDIYIQGTGTKHSSFTVNGGDIWCDNITVDSNLEGSSSDKTIGGYVNIDTFSKVYVQDDLNLYGSNSKVTIGGEYYGYSYEGVGGDPVKHSSSSTIIVNGYGSNLKLNLNRLVIGGRSYVIVSSSEDKSYMTGESLSVKANQDLYLIPAKYITMKEGTGISSNPMAEYTWNNNVDSVDLSSTFAYTEGLLNTTNPYTVITTNGNAYIYYNFKDKASSTQFVKRILAGADPTLKQNVTSYFSGVFTGGTQSGITISAGEMYTSGVLFQTTLSGVGNSGSSQTGSLTDVTTSASGSVITTDVFALTTLDCANRYKIISHLLVDMPEKKNGDRYIVDNNNSALTEYYDGFDPAAFDYFNNTAFENIVDTSKLSSEYNIEHEYLIDYMTGEGGLIKVVVNNSYHVPASVTGGVIVANGDVTLDHNFKGLILAKGSIKITNSASITTDAAMVENLIKNEYTFVDGVPEGGDKHAEDIAFKQFFMAYKDTVLDDPTKDPIQIENISYKDLVSSDNWRKN